MAFSLRHVAYHHVPPDPAAPDAPVQGIEIDRLDIPATGLTTVIGPSGSGKSTLLSVLAGFLGADIGAGGHLRFRNDELAAGSHPPGRIAFVFQSSLLLSAGSGLVNILQGQVAAGRRPGHDPATIRDIRHALDSLGLMDQRKILIAKRARHLSGGEAQRIAILRALLTDPDAILCDEPTSSLDESNAHRALGTLKEWAEGRQRPVVWVTHELDYAAEYADSFVFISGGRIAKPNPDRMAHLESATGGKRLEVLREIARDLKGDAVVKGGPHDRAADERPIRIGRARYAGWIANALSTDGPFTENLSDTALAPAGVQRLLGRVAHGYRAPFGPLIRLARRSLSYSRYGVACIFFVLLLQIFGAMFIGYAAEFYSAERLQDPSVARIVFEHVVAGPTLSRQGEPTELYADNGIPELEGAIRDRLADTIGTIDPTRVLVRGRRTIDQSQLRFPAASGGCGDWQSFETVALAVDDPLILQTGLAAGDDALLDSIEEAVAIARESYLVGGERRIAFLQSYLVEILHGRCGLDPDEPLIAEWAAGTAGRMEPLRLEIAGAIAEDPPLYPSAVDLIVFEHDYQAAANLQDGGAPPPFRIVTAYFPIDGFEAAGAVIADGGYRVRDDSAAAVATLRQVAQIAAVAPPLFIALNLLAAIIVINRAIDSLFELHKRVLALFAAHGFRLRDIFTVLGLHLLPAFVVSFVLLAALIYVGWFFVADWLPPDIGPLESLRDTAFLYSSGIAILVALSAMAIVVAVWWRHIGSHLRDLLQD